MPAVSSGINSFIAIASGKGGVGKSTVSANLACALVQHGARVGLMDTDVYGPSIPKLLGLIAAPQVTPDQRMVPVDYAGLKVMSMAFFMKPGEAIIWRGPMLHKTIQQFVGGVDWGALDYLLMDLPPGTGDIHLSICQTVALTGAIIVSTPQDIALSVAQHAIQMFRKLNVPIIGLIENMSASTCPHCGEPQDIFGSGGAKAAAERDGIPFLGAIPLAAHVRETSDAGRPIVLSHPEAPAAEAFTAIANQLVRHVMQHRSNERTPDTRVTFTV